jgi:hypothetical protein
VDDSTMVEGNSDNVSDRQSERQAVKAPIGALKARWPRHSVPPTLWEDLEMLEERLRELENVGLGACRGFDARRDKRTKGSGVP